MARERLASILVFMFAVACSTAARAVPIPWLNCGAPGDALSITQWDASTWPPTVAAPASATAMFDGAGHLVGLHLILLHGVLWTFDSGPLSTTTSAGFVSLPASFPATLTGPALPLAAGPYVTTRTFTGDAASVTILSKANLATPVTAPVTATIGLAANGTPGFPLVSAAGDVYQVRVQMSDPGGQVFCMTLNIPMKSASPFATILNVGAPTLSSAGMIALAVMLLGTGLVAGRKLRERKDASSR